MLACFPQQVSLRSACQDECSGKVFWAEAFRRKQVPTSAKSEFLCAHRVPWSTAGGCSCWAWRGWAWAVALSGCTICWSRHLTATASSASASCECVLEPTARSCYAHTRILGTNAATRQPPCCTAEYRAYAIKIKDMMRPHLTCRGMRPGSASTPTRCTWACPSKSHTGIHNSFTIFIAIRIRRSESCAVKTLDDLCNQALACHKRARQAADNASVKLPSLIP